jgi:hypothetical protein
MAFQTSHKLETETISTYFVNKNPRGTSLRAQWQLVDGKLVCKWFKDPD